MVPMLVTASSGSASSKDTTRVQRCAYENNAEVEVEINGERKSGRYIKCDLSMNPNVDELMVKLDNTTANIRVPTNAVCLRKGAVLSKPEPETVTITIPVLEGDYSHGYSLRQTGKHGLKRSLSRLELCGIKDATDVLHTLEKIAKENGDVNIFLETDNILRIGEKTQVVDAAGKRRYAYFAGKDPQERPGFVGVKYYDEPMGMTGMFALTSAMLRKEGGTLTSKIEGTHESTLRVPTKSLFIGKLSDINPSTLVFGVMDSEDKLEKLVHMLRTTDRKELTKLQTRLAKGKKQHDKREAQKAEDERRRANGQSSTGGVVQTLIRDIVNISK